MRPDVDDYLYLISKLDKYGLKLADKIVDDGYNRGEGIMNYLKEHPEIDVWRERLGDNWRRLDDFAEYIVKKEEIT